MEAIEDVVPLKQRDRAVVTLAGRHREDRVLSRLQLVQRRKRAPEQWLAFHAGPRAVVAAVAFHDLVDPLRTGGGRQDAHRLPRGDAGNRADSGFGRHRLVDGGEGVGDGFDDQADGVDQRSVHVEDDEAHGRL